MVKFIQDILSFSINSLNWIINLITEKDFYIPLIAVFFAWLLAFIPQKRQNIQHSIFELMKNQMDLLSQIEIQKYKGASFFIYAKHTLQRLYNFISKEIEDVSINPTDYYSNPLNSEVLEFSDTLFGRESLKIFYRNKPVKDKNETEIKFERRKAEYVYEYFFETHYIFVGHYFRHLYNIIKFINKSRILINRKFYTGLIQAQMSAPELYVLFYNGLKFEKLANFINKYCLIENLAKKDLMKLSHYNFYNCKMKDRTELSELEDAVDFLLDKSVLKKEFEERFFYLLDHLKNIVNTIEVSVEKGNGTKLYKGKDFFSYVNYYVKNFYEMQLTYGPMERQRYTGMLASGDFYPTDINRAYNESPTREFSSKSEYENNIDILKKIANHSYAAVHNKYHEYLDPYFKQLLYILKYLESKENIIKKFDGDISEYLSIIQSRLSSKELLLLFYHGLFFVEMIDYINKYNIIENLSVDDLIDEKHQKFYTIKMKSKNL